VASTAYKPESALREPEPGEELANETAATHAAFFVTGVGVSGWAPLVPYAKARLGIDDGTLGLLILCLGIGSVTSMPICNYLIRRLGCRRVICLGVGLMSIALPLLAATSTVASMAGSLLVFGGGIGLLNVSINVHAMLLEDRSRRQLMSGFHGMFSVGGIVGSVVGSAFLWFGMEPIAVSGAMVVMAILLTVWAAPGLIRHGSKERATGHGLSVPHGIVIAMGLVGLCVFLVEGAMLDWSALFLTSIKDFPPKLAGFGYAGFAIAMAAGRFFGDALSARTGPGLMVLAGGICGATGIACALVAPGGLMAILGFTLTGIGCSNIVPVLFSAVGRQKSMEPGAAIAALTTMGYAGALAGPAAIGFVSHAIGLSAAFCLLGVLLLLAALGGRCVFR
jgi:fucose permease